MALAAYIGRRVDLLAFEGASESVGEVELDHTLSLANEGGKIVSGIQKLAQRFLLELLTEKGSLRYEPTRGTTFLTEARVGSFRTQVDVLASFSAAMVDVRANLKSDEVARDPLDEKFASATVASINFLPGFASITVFVTSRAGSTRQIIVPLGATL